jgi:hypothetical protein
VRNPPDRFLWALLTVSALIGVAEAFLRSRGTPLEPLAISYMVAVSVLLFGWCRDHARSAQIREPVGSAVLCGLVALIGVPLYFFRAFGFRRGVIGTLRSIGFFLLMAVAYGVPRAAVGYFLDV